MESFLFPVIANLFIEAFEEKAIQLLEHIDSQYQAI